MKRLLKWVFSILLLLFFVHSCVFHYMTHMNDEELAWVTNRHEGEIMYFKSQAGIHESVTIKEITIHNSLNPINWGYFNTSNKDYIATADVRYILSSNAILSSHAGGVLHIEKMSKDRPISFSSVFDGWIYDIPLNTTSLEIDGITINDIVFFENEKSDSNVIKSYSWSKKYGLVQYTFQDGTVFSRVLK